MNRVRRQIQINGIVQGVGFRPYVYNTALKYGLTGFVANNSRGVLVEVEGTVERVAAFNEYLQTNPPSVSRISSYIEADKELAHDDRFEIRASRPDSSATTLIAPDIATCDDCLRELFDTTDRRYRYPLINCTNCGPRFTIVKRIPYDRPLTSMSPFELCSDCAREYHDPTDRRFHAQPNACPVCGPRLSFHDNRGAVMPSDPINATVDALTRGTIVAIKGIGGFHLAVDPYNAEAVKLLRERKGRSDKPFALMVRNIETARRHCVISPQEEKLLEGTQRPIVLLQRRSGCDLPENIAPRNNYLGLMLPYTPLHHLLLESAFDTLIMTSANFSEEPIVVDNNEAFEQLKPIADCYLTHDREILQRCDDSIVRVDQPSVQVIRRARGFVPLPLFVKKSLKPGILAVGGEQKNCVALARSDAVFLSQHIGDLDNPQALGFFKQSIGHLAKIMEIKPTAIIADMHPEYLSTKWAHEQKLPVVQVQHHHAHLASVMAENDCYEPTIGIVLDGTGYGTDGTIWGGEVLIGEFAKFERFAWLKPVPLPGGASAVREPYRMGLAYLHSLYGDNIPYDLEFVKGMEEKRRELILCMIERQINSPLTSSCGRLFDAVSSILGIRQVNSFEAQAAIELEMAALRSEKVAVEPLSPLAGEIDLSGLLHDLIDRSIHKENIEQTALYFHFQLAEYFIAAANGARESYNINRVALSGGVFQNRLFFEYCHRRLHEEQFSLLVHHQLPTNDGGLALGQLLIGNAILEQTTGNSICV